MILIVAILGVAMRVVPWAWPLTPSEAIRVARAEMVRRDPAFVSEAVVFSVCPGETNVGHLWSWAYRWEVVMKRKDAPTGYFIQIIHRNDIRVGRAYDILPNSMSWDLPT